MQHRKLIRLLARLSKKTDQVAEAAFRASITEGSNSLRAYYETARTLGLKMEKIGLERGDTLKFLGTQILIDRIGRKSITGEAENGSKLIIPVSYVVLSAVD